MGVKYLYENFGGIIMINNSGFDSMDKAHTDDIKNMLTDVLAKIEGYDAEKTQVLQNVSGTLTWVNESAGS